MAEPAFLSQFVDNFWGIRGWRPRRLYLSSREYYDALKAIPLHLYDASRASLHPLMYDGCVIIQIFNQDVASKIRHWDTAPWPS